MSIKNRKLKRINFILGLLVMLLGGSLSVSLGGCGGGDSTASVELDSETLINYDTTDDHPLLSREEVESLLFMREEEELARDLYLDIYAAKDERLPVFKNISDRSETEHAEAIRLLLESYGIEDPSTGEHHTYTNPVLQSLYDQLLSDAVGGDDLAAFYVGAFVEESDIRDIVTDMRLFPAAREDILDTYAFLLCGSRNHLRAFVKQIERTTGEDYVVQLPEIADVLYAVINSDTEQCTR